MKLSIKRSKRGTEIVFKATTRQDGLNLKTALLASLRPGTLDPLIPARVIDELEKIGYGVTEINGENVVKNPHAVALGRLGGKKGGDARAAKLTAAQRSAIAKKASRAAHGEKP
jgi:hypothetical protein